MQIELSEEQVLLHRTIREFAATELRPHGREWDRAGTFPMEIVPKLAGLGLLGLTVPQSYGGSELGMIGAAIAIEGVAWGDGAIALSVASHNALCTGHLLHFANAAQKRQYLPRLAAGELLGAWCLTEPSAGSDAAAIRTRAIRKSRVWVLNGSKAFVTQGSIGGVYVVMAVTDPAAGRRGISAFIVDRDAPGLRVGKKEDKFGVRACDTSEVIFEDCEVRADQLIGAEGDGYGQAMATLERGRIGIGAMAVGLGRASLDESMAYAAQRTTFGRALTEHQAIQFMIADMATELEAAWLLVLRAAQKADLGEPFRIEGSMAKLYASEAASRAANKAVQIHGGYGYIKDYPVERFLRDVKLTEIGEGTSEVQRIIIAKSLVPE